MSGQQLPSRYDEILDKKVAEICKAVAAESSSSRARWTFPKNGSWQSRAVILGGGLLIALKLMGGEGSARSDVSRPDNLLSSQAMGMSNDLASLLPPQKTATPTPKPSPTPTPKPRRRARRSVVARPTATPCSSCEAKRQSRDRWASARVLYNQDGSGLYGTDLPELPAPTPTPKPAAVVNMGTRIKGELLFPFRTHASSVPVALVVTEDVVIAGRVGIRVGDRFIGRAVSTRVDDRAQIIFIALVQDGQTIRSQGIALGPDGQIGVEGKLIRKASGQKHWLGKAVGAVGRTLTFNTLGGGSAIDEMTEEFMRSTGGDLAAVEQRWAAERSDKVVEVKSGAEVTIVLEDDLTL